MKKIALGIVFLLLLAAVAWAQATPASPPPTPTPAPDNGPKTAEDFFQLAVGRFQLGDLAGAERNARTAMALQNRFLDAHYLLGRVMLFRAAEKNRVLIENRGADSAVLPVTDKWTEGGPELQEATSQFRTVIQLDPTNRDAWLLLATCLDNMGEDDDAINAYQQTINLDPSKPTARDAHNNLGLLLMARKDYKGAKSHFDSALAIDPTFNPSRMNLEKLKKKAPKLFK